MTPRTTRTTRATRATRASPADPADAALPPRPRRLPPRPRWLPDPPPQDEGDEEEDEEDEDDGRYMMLRHSDDDDDEDEDDGGGGGGDGGPHHIPKSPELPRTPDRGGGGGVVDAGAAARATSSMPTSIAADGASALSSSSSRGIKFTVGAPPPAAATTTTATSDVPILRPPSFPEDIGGGSGGAAAAQLVAAPSWGSIDIRQVGTFDHCCDGGGGSDASPPSSSTGDGVVVVDHQANVITPAQTARKGRGAPTTTAAAAAPTAHSSSSAGNNFVYPPSSPIKASTTCDAGGPSASDDSSSSSSSPASSPPLGTSCPPPPRRSSPVVEMEDEYEYEDDECADDDGYEDEEETVPAEWSPPQNASLRRRRGAGEGGGRRPPPPSVPSASMGPTPPRPQFVRRRRPGPGEVGGAGGAGRPPPPPPRLVNLSSGSGSGDSREEARAAGGDDPYCVGVAAANGGPSGRDRRPGGRIQVVGGGSTDMSPWGGIVSRSRSAESGGGGAAGMGAGSSVGGSNEWEPPRPTRQPMVPPPGPPVQGVGGGHGTTGHPHPYSNPHYVTWDYYGGQRPPHHPPPYSPDGRPSPSLAYPGPPPQSSYPPDAGGYAPYPSSYPPQYQQFRPSQYPPHHPAYSQYPHPHPHPHHYRHSHHPGVPPPGSGGVVLEDRDDKRVPEESRPLLKNYDPEVDGVGKVRPQFQNVKRGKSSVAAKVKIDRGIARLGTSDAVAVPPDSSGGRAAHLSSEDAPTANTGEFAPHTPRRRRRRNPSEKAAAAAAMAAAAAVSMRERKRKDAVAAEAKAVKREVEEARDDGTDDEDDIPNHVATGTDAASISMTGVIAMGGMAIVTSSFSEEELKTLGSGDDEDIPAAKRAAMASAVALRAVAGGSPVKPPKSASEVDFDIADPPTLPITEPSDVPTLESTTLMTENDVLCGRGGGTNSQMGNRRFRALVRDFQPTYLMAKRREKPKMARSVVLIVRHRGGRFLRRDDMDGRLYEVGDEKAEAKTSQALREGLDVRATKTAANTLMGTTAESTSKKRKHIPPSPSLSENEKSSKRSIVKLEGGTGVKDEKAPVRPQPVHAPSYVQASQTSRLPPVATSGGYYPPYPQRYDDPYYGAHYRPNAAATAAYEYRTPTIHLPPGSFDPPSTTHHHHIHQYARGGGYHYPPSYPGYADPREGAYPSPPPSREPVGGSKEVASSPSDAAAFSPPRSHLVKKPKMMPQHLTPIISQSKGHRLE